MDGMELARTWQSGLEQMKRRFSEVIECRRKEMKKRGKEKQASSIMQSAAAARPRCYII